MENDNKTSDSLLNQQPQSKLNSGQIWAQLTAEYLNELPQQLDEIRTALEVKDYTTIKKQAHRIKGTCGTYRLDTIFKSIAQLEHLADSQNPDAIATTIDKVMQAVELETDRLNSRIASTSEDSEGNTNG